MSPIQIVDLTATLLWCHAAVLGAAWARAVARSERRYHVGHVVSLLGELVPMAVAVVLLVFAGSFLGLPSVVVFLAIVYPAGLVLGLVFEVRRICDPSPAAEAARLAASLVLAVLVLGYRGLA